MLSFSVREKLLTESPMAAVIMPKVDKRILPSFATTDISRLLKACTLERDEAIVLLLLDSGMRAAELVNLDGDDIDLKTGNITIRKGKGGKDRVVYLGAKARKQISRYYLERDTPGEHEPVFLGESAKSLGRLTQSGLNQMLQRLGKRAEVEHCSVAAVSQPGRCRRKGCAGEIWSSGQSLGYSLAVGDVTPNHELTIQRQPQQRYMASSHFNTPATVGVTSTVFLFHTRGEYDNFYEVPSVLALVHQ